MTCQGVRAQLSESMDGFLPAEAETALQAHLRDCASCRAEHARLEALVAHVRALGVVEPPPDLVPRIHEKIALGAASHSPRLLAYLMLPYVRTAAAAALVLSVCVYGYVVIDRERSGTVRSDTVPTGTGSVRSTGRPAPTPARPQARAIPPAVASPLAEALPEPGEDKAADLETARKPADLRKRRTAVPETPASEVGKLGESEARSFEPVRAAAKVAPADPADEGKKAVDLKGGIVPPGKGRASLSSRAPATSKPSESPEAAARDGDTLPRAGRGAIWSGPAATVPPAPPASPAAAPESAVGARESLGSAPVNGFAPGPFRASGGAVATPSSSAISRTDPLRSAAADSGARLEKLGPAGVPDGSPGRPTLSQLGRVQRNREGAASPEGFDAAPVPGMTPLASDGLGLRRDPGRAKDLAAGVKSIDPTLAPEARHLTVRTDRGSEAVRAALAPYVAPVTARRSDTGTAKAASPSATRTAEGVNLATGDEMIFRIAVRDWARALAALQAMGTVTENAEERQERRARVDRDSADKADAAAETFLELRIHVLPPSP